MSSQHWNAAERAKSNFEDDNEAEESFSARQYDPDSLRTHVTETQLPEGYGLEIDHLSQHSTDDYPESQLGENSLPQPKDSPDVVILDALPAGPKITRPDVRHEEPPEFTFGTPPVMAELGLGFSRNLGNGRASMIHNQNSSARTPFYSGNRSPTRPKAVEPEKKILGRSTRMASQNEQDTTTDLSERQRKVQQGDVSQDQPSDSLARPTAETPLPIQVLSATPPQCSEQLSDDLNRDNESLHAHSGSTQQHSADAEDSDILLVWPGNAQTQAQAQAVLMSRQEEHQLDNSRVPKSTLRSDNAQSPSHRRRGHPAMRPGPPHLAEPQVMPETKSKVNKTRRRFKAPKETHAPISPAQLDENNNVPSQEDLLTILLFKTRQEKKNRDAAKALLQSKEADLERVQQASEILRNQMKELSQRESAQGKELARYQNVIPALKIRARKLMDFVAGLTKDHNNLRSNAETIQQQQEELIKRHSEVKAFTAEAHKALRCSETNTAKRFREARDYIAKLEQQVEEQNHLNGDTTSRLEAEQERSDRLQQEIFNISGIQREMMELLNGLRQATAEKLDEILKQPPATMPVSDEGKEQATAILDRCSEILAEIKAAKDAGPEDLLRLDNSFSDYAEQLSKLLLQLIETSKHCRSDHLKFKREMQKQLEELTTTIKGEHRFSEQLIDLHEVKATLKERAQAGEAALTEARQMVIGLQGREQLLIQEVAGLRAEVSALLERPKENPEANARLRQTEALNTEMQAEIARLLSETSMYAEKLNQGSETITGLQDQMSGLESQLVAVKGANVLLEKQKSGCEAQAQAKYENLKTQLLEATNAERAILTEELSKISQQMQRKKEAAENKAKSLDEELGMLKAVQTKETEKSSQVQVKLEGLQAQLRERGEELAQLQEKLRLTEEDLDAKRAENQLLEEATLNKDRQLSEAEALLAKSVSESKSREEERLRRVNHALQSFNGTVQSHTSIDEAMGAILRSWEESQKRHSQDPMLDDLVSSHELLYNHEVSGLVDPVDHNVEEVQDMPYCRNTFVNPDRDSPVIPGIHSQGHEAQPKTQYMQNSSKEVNQNKNGTFSQRFINGDNHVIHESQMEETLIRRNLTTTRSSRSGDGSIMPFQTPSRKPQTAFSQLNDQASLFSPESPDFDTQDLFPPTPLPTSKLGNFVRQSSITEQTENHHGSSLRAGRNGTSQSASVPTVHGNGALRNTPAPRGILKRPSKRKLGSEYGLTPGERTSKRQPSAAERQGLGPIIPDSQQSPTTSANKQKPRKSRRVSQGHGQGQDKFIRRFSGLE